MPNHVKIIFTGNFLEYCLTAIFLFILSILTFGLAFPYLIYWSIKYFFTRMEIELPSTIVELTQNELTHIQ